MAEQNQNVNVEPLNKLVGLTVQPKTERGTWNQHYNENIQEAQIYYAWLEGGAIKLACVAPDGETAYMNFIDVLIPEKGKRWPEREREMKDKENREREARASRETATDRGHATTAHSRK
jgi:hypothetical protein